MKPNERINEIMETIKKMFSDIPLLDQLYIRLISFYLMENLIVLGKV